MSALLRRGNQTALNIRRLSEIDGTSGRHFVSSAQMARLRAWQQYVGGAAGKRNIIKLLGMRLIV